MKHRKVATCNECHHKIDPLGFALESYDPIGAYRSRYKKRQKIDTSGEMPTGEKFRNIEELKRILMLRKDQFARCLSKKMLIYATGRMLNLQDRANLDQVLDEVKANGYGLRDLVFAIIELDSFRSK